MQKSRKVARRRKKEKKQKGLKTLRVFWLALLLLILSLVCYFFYKLSTLEKFFFVQTAPDGGAEVIVFDPRSESVLSLLIPGNTKLDLSKDLGFYKLESAWKLAEKEKLDGELISKSLVKNFSIPVYLWKTGHKSNLDLYKTIKVAMIKIRIGRYSFLQTDLSQTTSLKKEKFLDSTQGYVINKSLPSSILVSFVDQELMENPVKIEIVDVSGSPQITQSVSDVLSVMGYKVSSYSKQSAEDTGCFVSGKSKDLVKKISLVFGCQQDYSWEGGADIQLKLGKVFAKNF